MKAEFNTGSNYVREGQWVIAKYLDQAWVTGTVVESRVKYGGKVQHTIVSDSPTYVNEELREVGYRFLIEEKDVTEAQIAAIL